MGCIASKEIDDTYPNVFKVINVDDYGNQMGSGLLEIKNFEIVLYQKGRSPIMWPLKTLRRYGFDADHFSFESGRRCRTGPGIYAFRCQRAEQLFNLIQSRIQVGEFNGVGSSGRGMNLRNSFSAEDSLFSGGSSRRTAPNRFTSQGGTGRLSSSGSLGAISPMSTTSAPIIMDTTLPSLNLPDVPEDSPPTQNYENDEIITANISQNFKETNYYEQQRPPFMPLGNHTYANSFLASTDRFKLEKVKKSTKKINDVKIVLEGETTPSPKVENAREYMNILPETQPILSGTQTVLPGPEPTPSGTQPILPGPEPTLPGTQPILPGTQPIHPEAQTVLPGPEPTLSGTQPIHPEAQAILPETQPILPEAQAILPGAQAILPEAQAILPGTQTILPGAQAILPGAQAILPEAQAILPGAQAILPGTQAILPGTQFILSGVRPILSGPGPIFSGTRPILSGTRPILSGTRPILSGTRPIFSGTRPIFSGTRPILLGTRPILLGTQPILSGSQPTLSGTLPKLTRTQPKLTGTQPKLTGTQPKLSETQAMVPGTQPTLSGTQPKLAGTQPKLPKVIDKAEPPASPEPEEIELVERRIDLYDAPDTFNKFPRGSLHRISKESIFRAPPRPGSLHRISEEPSLQAPPRPSKSLNYIVLDLERTGDLPRSPTSPSSENGQQPSGGYTSIDFQRTVALSHSIHPDSDLDRDSCRKTRHSSNALLPEIDGSSVGD